ncbi:MAG: cation:dicarboxylase symporter family transporter [Cytophagaceae bacterium]|nr:cation:dicarboxylase symporter family transporter [Cytophagaceae bacterium]MBL0301238.1 cation:dicarboxylase symporter family transporter [Cytophagaceae bacterium]MBL0324054.1 cation:dicarboxylase symporter family transporter [Cytophagaceae bacterium]
MKKDVSKYTIYAIFITLFFASLVSVIPHFTNLKINELIASIFRWAFIASMIWYGYQKKSLTAWILISMLIGAEVGNDFPEFAVNLKVVSKIFIKLIKTIIGPLLFSTLVAGIAGHSDLKQVGRMGWKSLLYFEVVTTIALFIGLFFANWIKPGEGIMQMPGTHEELPQATSQTWQEVLLHIFPENIAKSIAEGQTLQIVVFSVLFGIGVAMLSHKKREKVVGAVELLSEVMFKFTAIVMYFAPFAVGSAIAVTVGHMGFEVLKNLALLLMTLYLALTAFIGLVLVPVMLIIKVPVVKFIKNISEPLSIAFATTSSESALPKAMEQMERFGVPRHIVSFVMPTGYSFNLDGSTLYLSLAAIFVAQAAQVDFPVSQQIIMLFTLMLTSKGVAGVPRATLVILLGTLASFGLPEWPVLLIIGIDELMDMARTTVNVFGNCLATTVVARWEGELDDEKMHTEPVID